jgi:hypothetical protein
MASGTFDMGKCYQESFPTFAGMKLSETRFNLLRRRRMEEPGCGDWRRGLARQRECLAAWVGDQLPIDAVLAHEDSSDAWAMPAAEDETEDSGHWAQLLARLTELHDRATVLGIRRIVLDASYLIGWNHSIATRRLKEADALRLEDLKHLPEGEQHFQSVLELEQELGWIVHSVDVYQRRCFLIEDANEDPIVDYRVGWYLAARQAGYPMRDQTVLLNAACTALANHGSTHQHLLLKAQFFEQLAELTETGLRERAQWRHPDLEDEVANLLFFAANARMGAGQFDLGADLLEKARRLVDRGRLLRPENDGTRARSIEIWAVSSELAQRLGRPEEAADLLARCWVNMRPHDESSAYIFRLVLGREQSAGLLGRAWEQDRDGSFTEEPVGEGFQPSAEVLAKHQDGLNRFGWRFLQFEAAAAGLRDGNNTGFFATVLKFGELARTTPLDDRSKRSLLSLLQQAEEHYGNADSSNLKQRQAIRLIIALDPSRAAEFEHQLAGIEHEDQLLAEWEAAIESIENSGCQDDLVLMDAAFLRRQSGIHDNQYVDACTEAARNAELLITDRRFEEAAQSLAGLEGEMKPDSVLWVELRLLRLELVARSGIAIEPPDLEEKRRRFQEAMRKYLTQRFPNERSERIEQLAFALEQRLAELDPPIDRAAATQGEA